MGWGDTFAAAYQGGLAARENRRRYEIEREAERRREAMAEAARQRLERQRADDAFMAPLEKLALEAPGVAEDELTELRGVRPFEDNGLTGSPRNMDLERAAREKIGAALEARRQAERAAKVTRARGNATGLSFKERLALALGAEAGKAKRGGAAFQPKPGAYIAPDPKTGRPGLRGYGEMADDMRTRGDEAAQEIEGMFPVWRDLGSPPPPARPDVTRGNMSPVPPTTSRAMPRVPQAPQAPRPPGPSAQIMMRSPEGEVGPVDPDEVEQALAAGYVRVMAPGMGR